MRRFSDHGSCHHERRKSSDKNGSAEDEIIGDDVKRMQTTIKHHVGEDKYKPNQRGLSSSSAHSMGVSKAVTSSSTNLVYRESPLWNIRLPGSTKSEEAPMKCTDNLWRSACERSIFKTDEMPIPQANVQCTQLQPAPAAKNSQYTIGGEGWDGKLCNQ